MKVSKGGTTQRGIVRGGSQPEEVPLGQSQFVAVAGVEDAIQREGARFNHQSASDSVGEYKWGQ